MENMVFKGRIDVVVYAQSREESALLMEQEGARLSVSAKHRPSRQCASVRCRHPKLASGLELSSTDHAMLSLTIWLSMIAFMWYMALRKVVAGGEIHLTVLTRYRERNVSSFGVLRNRILILITKEVIDCSVHEICDHKICSRYAMETDKSDRSLDQRCRRR